MIWRIAKKEFLLNLMTFKFAAVATICVVLVGLLTPVLLNDYQQRLKDYNAHVAANEAELRKVNVYFNILLSGIDVYRPPVVMSVFSKGAENQLSDSAKIRLHGVSEISARLIDVNPYLSILPTLDISLILKIIVSVLALLVACDVISGERERGTLKLILSGTVARHKVLLGKFLAGLITLLVPLTIAFIVGLLILLFWPMVDLTVSDWVRIGLMYFVSLIFISTMYNIGLFVSCLTKSSSISLMLGLVFWVVFIMVIPNVSVYLATQVRPLEPEEKMESRIRLVEKERQAKLEKIPWAGEEVWPDGSYLQWCILVCNKEAMECRQKRFASWHPVNIKYAEKRWEIRHRHVETLFQQKELADCFSRISPIAVYENLISALAGTDAANCQYFMNTAKAYWNEVVEYVRSKTDNFSSPLYFTQCTEADMAVYQEYLDGKMPEDDFRKWKEKKTAQMIPLDLQDFPQFIYKLDVVKDFQRGIIDVLVLVLISVLFFVLSFTAFVKYDVR